jgi:bifunctional UDP-N-acetylglucosamine pyrophosphorylase/glucosamine-1-phosphate N-acetyltransferase
MKNLSVVILAAGEGTRMKSAKPKVLHGLAGTPLVRWVLSAVKELKPESIHLVVGHGAAEVRKELSGDGIVFVEQRQRLGSGHALRQAAKHLRSFRGDVLVLCADTPLIRPETLRRLITVHRKEKNAATVLSGRFSNPFGYGRIVRSASGRVKCIVEEKDATPEQKPITEINSGIYCFASPSIWNTVSRIRNMNAKREYYLTDAIAILDAGGRKVGAYSGVTPEEIFGINDRINLAAAEEIVRSRVLAQHMANGVTIPAPQHTYVLPGAKIGRDTVLYPGTVIESGTVIGNNCRIGPYTLVRESRIGDNAEIFFSCLNGATVGDGVRVGPYAHLRPGAVIRKGARVGNFSEVKKSVVGEGSKVNHLSYIGDAYLGRGVNIGAGTITCNFDGVNKNKTFIGDRTFVGSNVNLVAPIKIGADAVLAAGSTFTENVPGGALGIARSRQIHKTRKIRGYNGT